MFSTRRDLVGRALHPLEGKYSLVEDSTAGFLSEIMLVLRNTMRCVILERMEWVERARLWCRARCDLGLIGNMI